MVGGVPGRGVYALRAVYWALLAAVPVLASGLCGPGLGGWGALALRALGFAVAGWGVFLNVVAGRTLRLYGHSRRGPRFRAPDRLVDVGVYSCMRHPAQLGLILFGVGVAVATASPAGLLAGLAPVAGGLAFILLVEEPEARRLLGRAYHEYEDRVPAFTLDPRCALRGLSAIRGRPSS